MKRTSSSSSKSVILAMDPSLTGWGIAILQNHVVIHSECIKTAPEAKKRRIREGDDRVRRTMELVDRLRKVINDFSVDYMVAELPHGSQNFRGAVMLGVVTGIMVTLSECEDIPIEFFSEADAKKALLGRISASKTEVIEAVEETFEIDINGPKYVREAVADSLAIYNVAQKQSTTLKILTR